VGVLSSALLLTVAGQVRARVSLERINQRRDADFAPVMEGEVATVTGTVSSKPIVSQLYVHLPIQDESGRGLLLEGTLPQLSSFQPGARVEARGTLTRRAGEPALVVTQIQTLFRGTPPDPKPISADELNSFRYLGVLVEVDGRVLDKGENTAGEFLLIGDARKPMRLLLPVPPGRGGPVRLDRFEIGDRVRAVGVGSQYCPFPPFNRSFQMVLRSDEEIVLLRKRWLISPEWFAVSIAFLAVALGLWWMRERRMSAQRTMVRTFYSIGEEVIGVASPAETLRRLTASLMPVLRISGVHIYLHDRSIKALARVEQGTGNEPFSVPVQAPEGSLPLGPAVCFRNEAMLMIPDTRRSPFFPDGRRERQPGAVLFVPMFAESEIFGVLELFDNRAAHQFTRDERVLTQHLANQIGIGLRLMEEKSVREQLFRSEKLAAVGQLVSGIAAELKAPLENIAALSENIVGSGLGLTRSDVQAIATESKKAAEIVARLVSFMQPERAEPKRIELNALLRSLIEFRRQEWRNRGVEIEEMLSPSPISILGSRGQLERVFLDLLVQVEHAISTSNEKRLSIATTILGRRAVVEIEYTATLAQAWDRAPGSEAALHAEGVARGIVRGHGGDLRVTRSAQGQCRLELELPMAPARATEATGAARALTCMVVEPEKETREVLVRALTQRGSRVIPAVSAEEGAELVQRLRFDIVFCAVRLPGLNWIEFSERFRSEVGSFVLLTEGYDYELSRGFVGHESFVLAKPIIESDLESVLAAIEEQGASAESRLTLVRPFDRRASGLY